MGVLLYVASCAKGDFTPVSRPKELKALINSIAEILQVGTKHFRQGLSPYFHLSYVTVYVTWSSPIQPERGLFGPNLKS